MREQRYVKICGQIFRYEDKAPFQSSGKSVFGAVEVRNGKEYKCHECGEWHANLGNHIGFRHPGGVREYRRVHGLSAKTRFNNVVSQNRHRRTFSAEDRARGITASAELRAKGIVRRGFEIQNANRSCPLQTEAQLIEIASDLGRAPSQMDAPAKLVSQAVNRFGSWNKALVAAGLEPRAQGGGGYRVHTKISLIEALVDFYAINFRFPRHREWGTGRLPHARCYRRHFGSIQAAYDAAGLAMRHEKEAA